MSFIESRIIPDATVPGLSWRVTVFPDYDVTPSDADCYTPSQVKAWEAGEWQYVGVVVTPVIADTEFVSCDDSLWGLEYGAYLVTDEDDNETERISLDMDYFTKGTPEHPEYAYPVPDMIEACKGQLKAKLALLVAALPGMQTRTTGQLAVRLANTLRPGDLIVQRDKDGLIAVLILREREPCKDLFGREMFRFWARRRDTGAEGHMIYGPEGVVMEQPDFTSEQLEAGGFRKC